MQCPAKKFQLCHSITKQDALLGLVNCSSGWNTHVRTLLSLFWSFDIVFLFYQCLSSHCTVFIKKWFIVTNFTLPRLFRNPAISNFFPFSLGLRNSGVRLYIQMALYWIIWYRSLNYVLWGCRRNQTLPVITAFSSKVKIKYETEEYICVKTNNMDKFHKKWALPLDSVP